jgi:hypothetical protein
MPITHITISNPDIACTIITVQTFPGTPPKPVRHNPPEPPVTNLWLQWAGLVVAVLQLWMVFWPPW